MFMINNSQFLAECGGRNVLPRVLEVELPLLVPELGVLDGGELSVAEASEQLLGVVP